MNFAPKKKNLLEFRPDSKPVSASFGPFQPIQSNLAQIGPVWRKSANQKKNQKKKPHHNAHAAASTAAQHVHACQVQQPWSRTHDSSAEGAAL